MVVFSMVFGSAIFAACDRAADTMPTTPALSRTVLEPSLLTSEAARHLNAEGQFILSAPAAGAVPMITEAEAKVRAVAWARDFGSFNRSYLEKYHGAPIDFTKLQACSRAYFAASPYEDLPAGVPNFVRNYLGPQWLVSLCAADGTPQVSLAIAAYSTDVTVESGHLKQAPFGGAEHFWEGISRGTELPVAPERAAELAARLTGRRVAAVPELVLSDAHYAPQYARWRIVLDDPALFRSLKSGTSIRTAEVYIGADKYFKNVDFAVPDAAAPRERIKRYRVLGPNGLGVETARSRAAVRAGRPHGFEPATPVQEGR
jgi:hypothetical protein